MTVPAPYPAPPAGSALTGFAGIYSVVHLPLDDEGRLDVPGVIRLVDHLIGKGVTGLTVNGLASESWTLDAAERDLMCEHVVTAAAGRVPVVSGVDGGTRAALKAGARAMELGATRLMVRPPKGMAVADLPSHYRTLANGLDVDILVQDARADEPGLLTADQVLTVLGDHPRLRWVKVDEPSVGHKVSGLVAGGAQVITGWGGLHYPDAVRRGALGCMPGADLAPALVAIDALLRCGAEAEADQLYDKIEPLLRFEGQSLALLIAGAKLALTRAGVFVSARTRDRTALPAARLAEFESLFEELQRQGVAGW